MSYDHVFNSYADLLMCLEIQHHKSVFLCSNLLLFILTVKVVFIELACWLWVTDWLTDVENAITNPEFSKSSFCSSCLKLGYLHDGVDILLLL